MLITLNQKEIEKMILTGLADMGIPHEGATINMVAGRLPTGITAEIKLMPREIVIGTPVAAKGAQASFSDNHEYPALKTTDGIKGNVGDNHSDNTGAKSKDDDDDPSEPEDDTSLFDK